LKGEEFETVASSKFPPLQGGLRKLLLLISLPFKGRVREGMG